LLLVLIVSFGRNHLLAGSLSEGARGKESGENQDAEDES
jgi:hypothetical protein